MAALFAACVFTFMAAVRGTSSGVPDSLVRSANPRTAATLIRLAANGGSSQLKRATQ